MSTAFAGARVRPYVHARSAARAAIGGAAAVAIGRSYRVQFSDQRLAAQPWLLHIVGQLYAAGCGLETRCARASLDVYATGVYVCVRWRPGSSLSVVKWRRSAARSECVSPMLTRAAAKQDAKLLINPLGNSLHLAAGASCCPPHSSLPAHTTCQQTFHQVSRWIITRSTARP